MEALLAKVRSINHLVQGNASDPVDFKEIAHVLAENIPANIYLVGRRGKILGYAMQESSYCSIMPDVLEHSESFPESYNRQLLMVNETVANLPQNTGTCFFDATISCPLTDRVLTIVPVIGGGERLGSLVLTSVGGGLETESMILAEHSAVVVGLEILRLKTERVEYDTRRKAAVQIALGTLSYSEMDAAAHIFSELAGTSGILVASRIADRAGITRSVIVNALRKLESAGVIEAKSLGMKGTFIRILNDSLIESLNKQKQNGKVKN